MEFLAGETLAEVLKREGPLSPKRVLPLLDQIANALDAVHAANFIHRDLKPSNVMIVPGEHGQRVVLTDLLLGSLHNTEMTLAETGHIVGTLAYMAPELFTGAPASVQSDIYSFGVVIYQALTGRFPFEHHSLETVVESRSQPPIAPSRHNPNINRQWDATVVRCLATHPEERFVRASDVTQELRRQRGLFDFGGTAQPPSDRPPEPIHDPLYEDRVWCSAYSLDCAAREPWNALLTYVHVQRATPMVERHSRSLLIAEPVAPRGRATARATRLIRRGTEITIIPELPNCELTPATATVVWSENWHCAPFRFRRRRETDQVPLIGSVGFYVGPVLIADICLLIELRDQTRSITPHSAATVPYEAIFVSYSHEDTWVVNQLERAYTALGMQYLRDVNALRSGERWDPALLHKIDEADIFQLCWSHAAKQSPYVEREWRHATTRTSDSFIRPIYWEKPMPAPPDELHTLHFSYYQPAQHGRLWHWCQSLTRKRSRPSLG
jgi:hypothetical protein